MENELKLMANKLRIDSIQMTTSANSGHPTSCMSCAEIMSVLFFNQINENDEFIMSKGHAAPILWAAFAEAGIIPRKELMNLRKITSNLEGHPTPNMPWIKVSTGSLGQGLSAGVGMAAGKKIDNNPGRIFVLLGDGETAEGSVWEAANTASYYKLNNLCAIVDVNRLGESQETMHGHKLRRYKKKFEAFGWKVKIVDGHNVKALISALKKAGKTRKPLAIIAKTKKGKGFSEVEDKEGWHGKAFSAEMVERALKEIGPAEISLKSKIRNNMASWKVNDFNLNKYKLGEMVATRDAFGKALVNFGKKNKRAVAISGDLKDSTREQAFFNEFPKRSFESFIAEQNMVGMSIGLSAMSFIPVSATFATFFTRAHDFIRMAYYSKANIKFVGTHAGVSIGEDGPSQMGLEDISMFLSMPESVVLYPSDAISTETCFKQITKYNGISYLRATREKTPVIYKNGESFAIGKLKVLRKTTNDRVLVIGAGITVHEALKAHDELKKKGINIRVIDLYSIKPLDEMALLKNAKECKNKVILVEDHYFGGVGAAVNAVLGKIEHLYIKKMPRSGKPEKLRARFGIDYHAIINVVRKLR